jgi:hypothetical protein
MGYPWTGLPAGSGVLSYFGFTFDPLYRSRVACNPKRDEAGRTITDWEVTIEVDAFVTSGASGADRADATLTLMQQQLKTDGGELHYDAKGFGTTFTVNKADGTGVRDVAWGPKPKLLSFHPLGENNAAMVTWAVTTRVPFCPAAASYAGKPMAVNYAVDVTKDNDGYRTIAITGYLEIPMTYPTPGSFTLPDTADNYKSQIQPAIPPGFKRQASTRLSYDKRRLDFTFVDTEIPVGGVPIGCTSATGQASVRSSGMNSTRWTGTISASYVVPKRKPKSTAWLQFLALIQDRLRTAKSSGGSLIFDGLSINEGLYENKQQSFELNYTLFTKLATILNASGMWRPVPNTDFNAWSTSIQDVRDITGPNGWQVPAGQDAIINLCGGSVATMRTVVPGNQLTANVPLVPSAFYSVNPFTSWLRYQCALEVKLRTNILRHKPLNTNVLTAVQPDPNGPAFPALYTVSDLFQKRSSPSFEATLRGFAVRAGYAIPVPGLSSVGGAPAIIDTQDVRPRFIGALGGIPLVYVSWIMKYQLFAPPQGAILTPANPELFGQDLNTATLRAVGYAGGGRGNEVRTLTSGGL